MAVEDHTPIRRFRLPDEEWERYAEVVGERQRSADLAAYVRWRIEHPDAKLPGTKRVRRTGRQAVDHDLAKALREQMDLARRRPRPPQ